jgi:predicted ATPase
LCAFLLRSCPGLRILTTTRQALGIGGEAVFRVPPMTVPSEDLQHPVHSTSRCEAITLFTERAATIVPEFGLTDANHVAVSAICREILSIPVDEGVSGNLRSGACGLDRPGVGADGGGSLK